MTPPGKTRCIGRELPAAVAFERLLTKKFNLSTAKNPVGFLNIVEKWASLNAYQGWLAAYRKNAGTFLDHPVWGADRDLGDGHYLYGAMDDRYASNAARVFVAGGLSASNHVEDKICCVIGAWDGTECLLLRAMGAASVDSVDEVPAFGEMAKTQFYTWEVPGNVIQQSLYDMDVRLHWQMYDLVYVPGVLYHLTDLPAALVMLWSMIKPGGVLAFESISDPKGSQSARYIGARVPGWNWWSPTPECYVAAMVDCGFPDARTVEHAYGRGWWIGSKSEHLPALASGAAGFSKPEVLRTISELVKL